MQMRKEMMQSDFQQCFDFYFALGPGRVIFELTITKHSNPNRHENKTIHLRNHILRAIEMPACNGFQRLHLSSGAYSRCGISFLTEATII